MPTLASQRPYYGDSYRTSFDATVLETPIVAGSPAAVLDATYFYPTSGGQPHDTGSLNGCTVAEVRLRDGDGAVLHILDRPATLGPVSCHIDWARRWDHIQQHTGQHILSQAFVRVAGATTIGFHLGVEYVSIDLDTPTLADGALAEAFRLANDTVGRNLPVRAWFPTEAELATISLRKAPDIEGALRIVAIGDFDVSACGGTHVRQTAEVGLIHSLWTERLKRGLRVGFLCGDRARADYAAKDRIVAEAAAGLACAPAELPAAIARLRAEVMELERQLAGHREAALDREAESLGRAAVPLGAHRLVARVFDRRPPDELKALAMRLTQSPEAIALLATSSDRSHFVFARSDHAAVDLKPALDAALAAIGGGRGGGSRVVQGGGAAATAEGLAEALARATALLASQQG
ncbi:MAG: alanyl-tRNA editing protein [Gemmatimonadetes bacterium]|nr:alanyl-tRNA editing protein [Gemmatimonadota bacterium]